ncbi:MAG: site-specific integrase [Acidimicrobiales bacterium]
MGNPSRVRVIGPLVPYVAGFRVELERQGYRSGPTCDQLRLLAHVSRWLSSRDLDVGDLTPERVEEFLVARREAGYVLWRSQKGVAPLLAHLRRLGVVPVPEVVVPATPAEQLLVHYQCYLEEERGLCKSSVGSNVHVARLFLATRAELPELGLEALSGTDILAFLLDECQRRSVGSAKYVVTGLRSFLRFCHLNGLTPRPLADCVPGVASWRLASLPRALSARDVAELLASCDRRSTFGRRDFAVLTLLVRLGLRAGEVASLRLDDIDWRMGEIVVSGKGPKQARLPLPHDVGEAIAAWLARGRPKCAAREVFTRVRAPHCALSSCGVTAIVASACKRAGLATVYAHRLRHTAATEMLRAGAGLEEIGQILRHESLFTTAIYAKVDRVALRELARPWPGANEGAGR